MMILLQKSNDYNVTNYDDNDIKKVTPYKNIMNIMLQKSRVAELGSFSLGAKMAMKIFVKRIFTIFASNASFLRVIASLQNELSEICNIYHVIVHFLPKKRCF